MFVDMNIYRYSFEFANVFSGFIPHAHVPQDSLWAHRNTNQEIMLTEKEWINVSCVDICFSCSDVVTITDSFEIEGEKKDFAWHFLHGGWHAAIHEQESLRSA